jgi:hypothetical protein
VKTPFAASADGKIVITAVVNKKKGRRDEFGGRAQMEASLFWKERRLALVQKSDGQALLSLPLQATDLDEMPFVLERDASGWRTAFTSYFHHHLGSVESRLTIEIDLDKAAALVDSVDKVDLD